VLALRGVALCGTESIDRWFAHQPDRSSMLLAKRPSQAPARSSGLASAAAVAAERFILLLSCCAGRVVPPEGPEIMDAAVDPPIAAAAAQVASIGRMHRSSRRTREHGGHQARTASRLPISRGVGLERLQSFVPQLKTGVCAPSHASWSLLPRSLTPDTLTTSPTFAPPSHFVTVSSSLMLLASWLMSSRPV
jgi:hypothetical protein